MLGGSRWSQQGSHRRTSELGNGWEGSCPGQWWEGYGKGTRWGHNTFFFKDGEIGSREKDSTLLSLVLSRNRSLRGGVAGEGIWLRHLRTSAGGGGKEGRARELAQAAGTAAMALGQRSHFRSGPSSWQALEQSVPPQCKTGRLRLKFLPLFWKVSAPRWENKLQKWPPGPREKGLPLVPMLGGLTCPPLRSRELVLIPGRGDPFLVNHLGVEGQPRAQPAIWLPGQETVPISFGKGSVVRHSGLFRVPPHPPNHHHVFPVLSLPRASLPPL